MKRKDGTNIITSDDITVLGKNSGKTLEEVIEKLLSDNEGLKSNVKWLYKYGGVGGNGGGGTSTTTDKWTVVCSLGGIQIPESSAESQQEIRSILFSDRGNQKLYIHINNPGGDTYSIIYTYNGGRSRGSMILNASNRWTGEVNLNLQDNGNINVSVMNGDLLEKIFIARHIVDAYSILVQLVDNSNVVYVPTEGNRYDLFILDIKNRGLRYVVKYNSAVNVPVTYIYLKFRSSEEVRVTTLFSEGLYQEVLLDVEACDYLQEFNNNDAAQYMFKMKFVIGESELVKDIIADFLPNDLYLKIVPVDSETILYTDSNLENPITLIAGNRSFTITPYNGITGGNARITCLYLIDGVDVEDSVFESIAVDNVLSGKSFLRTFLFLPPSNGDPEIKEYKITFFASIIGTEKRYEIDYYYYVVAPENTIEWFNNNLFSSLTLSNFYRYGDSQLSQIKLTRNGSSLNPTTYIVKNINDDSNGEDIVECNETITLALEVLINIGIQYNYINDETKEIIELPTVDQLDDNIIKIYQNSIKLGESNLLGIFFIEEEENYDISDNSKYHLITIARKFLKNINNTNLYEISTYIDGVLVANTVTHILTSRYNSFILQDGNYCINLLDVSYFNNGTLDETNIVQYWYAYLTKILHNIENVDQKSKLLNITRKFNLERENGLYKGHVYIDDSGLTDLVLNVKVPILCIEYEPSSNQNLDFFAWSDYNYPSDSHTSLKLTIGVKWSSGTGSNSTVLKEIDTSSIETPDGQQKEAKFTLDILGSTTREYKSKNYTLKLEFIDEDKFYEPVFTPWFNKDDRNTFLPENSFTLKADIVDSAHTNNTCLGKFINNNTELFRDAELKDALYSSHIKNCLLGFPCLVFVHISGNLNYYFLGIYNFNLGRSSHFNLGYSNLKALPTNLRSNSSDVYDFNIYAVAKTTTEQEIGSDIMSTVITAEIDGNIPPYFDFSQYDDSILFPIPGINDVQGFMFSEITSSKNFERDNELVIHSDVKRAISNFVKKTSRSGGYIFDKLEKGFFNDGNLGYTSLIGYVPSSKILYLRVKHGTTEELREIGTVEDFNANDLLNYIFTHTEEGIEGDISSYCNYKSLVEYYTICMAFGLLDSVKKNLNIKTWNDGKTFYLAFYDMDTCLGINNDGANVSYYAFSDYWESSENDQVVDHDINGDPVYAAAPINVYRDYAPHTEDNNLYDAPSSYIFAVAKYAKSIIQYYNLLSNESNISLNSILTPLDLWATWRSKTGPLRSALYFIDNYYKDYMKNVNELIFNYNYKAKYFTEDLDASYNGIEAKRFRGRSIGYVRDWLTKRFHILDAYFNLLASLEIIIDDGARFSEVEDQASGYRRVYELYPLIDLLLLYSDDVSINKSIFGTGKLYNGEIDLVVQAPDYTPIIIRQGATLYRYLLLDSSRKYRILVPSSVSKFFFGGSVTWTYLDSINSIALGNVVILSNKLLIVNGDQGTVDGWALDLPALKEIHLNSENYAGNLTFDRDSNVYNLTDVDISGSKINLLINNKNVKNINLTNIKSGSVLLLNCLLLNNITFNNSLINTCVITPIDYINNGGTITLQNNNITDLLLSTSKNLNLVINNDNSLTSLSVSGFKTITINNCPLLTTIQSSGSVLTSLATANCSKIKTVTLTVTNCETINIGAALLDTLILTTASNYEELKTLHIPGSYINKIIYLKIEGNNSPEEWYSVPLENTINITPLIKLNSFNISGNPNIKYIIFPNDFNNPIPIRNSFINCPLLERIYGCVKIVNTNNTFSGLTNFSIHGKNLETLIGNVSNESVIPTLGNDGYWYIGNTKTNVIVSVETGLVPYIKETTEVTNGNTLVTKKWYVCSLWKGYNKVKVTNINGTDYSIVLTPLLLLTNEEFSDNYNTIIERYNLITKQDLFLSGNIEEGNYVTNIFFDSSANLTGTFTQFLYGTSITLFDVYYIFNSFGLSNIKNTSITIGNGAFYGLSNMFNYITGNQFNRYTFYKCEKITAFSATTHVFRTDDTLWYSPTVQDDNIVYDNGLFSPLKNLTTITRFSGGAYISRNVFRRKLSSEKYNLQTISWLSIKFIHDDVDLYQLLSLIPVTYTAALGGAIIEEHINKLGNMTDIFEQTKIKTISNTFGMSVINYDTLKFPDTITNINASFQNNYGFGTFNWKNTFDSNIIYKELVSICNSFILNHYLGSNYVEFKIYEDMFNNMPGLLYLGGRSADTGSNGGYTNFTPSTTSPKFVYGLRGDGFNKILNGGEFPYNIMTPISNNIINFVGLFCELYTKTNAPSITILFPGNMFLNCTKLLNISALFADNRVKIELTSEGFINCKSLSGVSRLFYTSVSKTDDNDINRIIQNTSIPYRFFYLGEDTDHVHTRTYCGTETRSIMEDDIAYMDGDTDNGVPFNPTTSDYYSFSYTDPIKSILYSTECFFGQDYMSPYVWDKTGFELNDSYLNPEYIPFQYYKEDDVWHERPNDPRYTKKYDISSIYDGDPDNLESDAYCQDMNIVVGYGGNTQKLKSVINYFCPPDLFNSFKNTPLLNINGMFRWCGKGGADVHGARRRTNDNLDTITCGRICPYLFNTINSVLYLTEFFENCKGINSYLIGEVPYMIPPELFSKTSNLTGLAKTFAGMYFDTAPNFNFLQNLGVWKKTLDVRGIFSMCYYQDSGWTISLIFSLNILNKISGAFCAREVELNSDAVYEVEVKTAQNNVRLEIPVCSFSNNITNSKNSRKLFTNRSDIGFVYYYVGTTEGKVIENSSILNLDANNNLYTTNA